MYTYPRPRTCLICSCPVNEGRFLEAILQRTERELPDRGAPERSTAWWPVERWEALRLALGARGALPREVGSPPASRVPVGALAPPTAPSPRAVREALANLGRSAPRERGSSAV